MKRALGFGVTLLGALLVLTALAAAAPRTTAAPVATVPIKILVKQDGWYRVALSGTGGWTVPADPTLLHLKVGNDALTGLDEVPFQLHGSTLEFYGRGIDTPDTDTRAYYLSLGGTAGSQMSFVRARATAGSPSGFFTAKAPVKRDRNRFLDRINGGVGPGWVGVGLSQAGGPVSRTFALTNVSATGTGSIDIRLLGFTSGNHTVDVTMNSTSIGQITFSGTNVFNTSTLSIAAGVLHDGTNTLELTVPNAGDIMFTDTYTLSYPHLFTADTDVLDFTESAASTVSIGGFTSSAIRLIDLTTQKELFGTVSHPGADYVLTFTRPGGSTHFYAFANSAARTDGAAEVDSVPDLRALTNEGRLLVITHKDFASAVQPLVDYRRNTDGYKVFVADVADVYDDFGYGVKSAAAVESFIKFAKENWAVKPDWVLLVGDASFDPRNYKGFGNFDFIPTTFVGATFTLAPSDDGLVDWTNDGTPELAIGRLPVRTAAEATTVVNKITAYGSSAVSVPKREVIAAQEFQDYHFSDFANDLKTATLDPRSVSTVLRIQPDGTAEQPTHDLLIADLNSTAAPPTIVNYFGHGNFTNWHGTLFQKSDVASLTNTKPALYLMMTCLNGYFADPDPAQRSLTEELLLAPNNHGAVASWGSTGETVPGTQPTEDGSQRSAVKRAQEWLLDHPNDTLGDAMVHAKSDPSITNVDVKRTWALIGDPSTKLR